MEKRMGMLLVAAAFNVVMLIQTAASAAVPAIWVFGDSTVDVGNNNFLPGNESKANFPPNGIDFPGGKPTGRFSNGYEGIDYFAKELGFKKSPPAYLSISTDSQARRGVNFASGGSGIFNVTVSSSPSDSFIHSLLKLEHIVSSLNRRKLGIINQGQKSSIPLSQQITYFREVSSRMRTRIGGSPAKRLLSKSIFYFSTGNNDMVLSYAFSGIQNKTQQDLLIGQLAGSFKNQLKTLYELGARKFLVVGTVSIGCIPVLRLTVPGGQCVEYLNTLSQQFNQATQIALQDLASNLKGITYSFVNYYDLFALILSEPRKYGFTELVSACCGSGRFNAESPCTPGTNFCSDRKKYIFWDQFHPTQALYKTITRLLSRVDQFASPITIKQLIRL